MSSLCPVTKVTSKSKNVNTGATHGGGRIRKQKLKYTQNRLSALICL